MQLNYKSIVLFISLIHFSTETIHQLTIGRELTGINAF
jgi:hypothetical protein